VKLLVLACITSRLLVSAVSRVKGLEGVNCQCFVGELDLCSTPSNADTKYTFFQIKFQNVRNFQNFGPSGPYNFLKKKKYFMVISGISGSKCIRCHPGRMT